MFTDKSYFKGVISLPESEFINGLLSDTKFIEKHEKDILVSLLGIELYNDLMTDKDTTDITNKWYKFIRGSTFTVNCMAHDFTCTWSGFVNSDKISFVAYYVYLQILKLVQSTLTDSGLVASAVTAQFSRVPMQGKFAEVNSEMLKMYGKVTEHPLANSALNYLKNTDDVFENWLFTELEEENSYGI